MQPSLIWGGCLALFIATVSAEDAVRTYRIPPQPLSSALEAFSRQADVEMFFPDEAVQGKQSPGLAGPYTPRQAMQKLLAGTGLSYTFTAEDSVAVRVAETEATPDAEGPEPKPASEQGATELPEMTVTASPGPSTSYNVLNATTATKTDTPIMETPYSIKVVPQQVLQDQQVFRLEKALQNVSGVTQLATNQGGSDGFIIRGFGSDNIYRDGFFIPNILGGGSSKRDTANLERIEVLKGPGSLLFGRTEPGGIINMVTKQPLATPYYSLQQQLGSFDFYRTTIDATGPVTQDDTLLYRFNLAYENADSFRDFVENDRIFLAPVLRWNISPRTQATLELEFQHFDDPQDPGIPPIGNRPAPVPRDDS